MKRTCLVATHYNRNLGDRCVLLGTLELLGAVGAETIISVSVFDDRLNFPSNRADISTVVPWGLTFSTITGKVMSRMCSLGVRAYANSKFFDTGFRNMVSEVNNVLVSGGHHLTDILGDGIFWCLAANIHYAVTKGKRTLLLPQTIGPIVNPTPAKHRVIEEIVRVAEHVFVRDVASLEFVQLHGGTASILPDMAFALTRSDVPKKDGDRMGICVYGNYADRSCITREVKFLAELVDLAVRRGMHCVFIPMEVSGTEADDRPLIKNIISMVNASGRFEIAEHNDNPAELLEEIQRCRVLVSYKTHGQILALASGIPVVATGYDRKSQDLMDSYGLKDMFIWDKEVSVGRVAEIIDWIDENYEDVQKSITDESAKRRAALFQLLDLIR